MFTDTKILEGLFESNIKVKLIKIFLRNKDKYFTLDEIITKTKEDSSSVRYQLKKLIDIAFVKSVLTNKIKIQNNLDSELHEKNFAKPRRFFLTNKDFQFLDDLEKIFSKSGAIDKELLSQKINSTGKVKFLLLSGIFLNKEHTRVDMLLVGDGINENNFNEIVNTLEDELGKEIRYSMLETREFYYRMDMFDNFLQSVLSEPSEILVDKLDIKTSIANSSRSKVAQ